MAKGFVIAVVVGQAVALAVKSLPTETQVWPLELIHIQAILVSLFFEVARAVVLIINMEVWRRTDNAIMPGILITGSVLITGWIAWGLKDSHFAAMALAQEGKGPAPDLVMYHVVQGCNVMILFAELALSFLMSDKALSYQAISKDLAAYADYTNAIRSAMDNLAKYLAAKSPKILAIEDETERHTNMINKAKQLAELCERKVSAHNKNLELFEGMIISLKAVGTSNAVRALLCSCGAVTRLRVNSDDSCTCRNCGKYVRKPESE